MYTISILDTETLHIHLWSMEAMQQKRVQLIWLFRIKSNSKGESNDNTLSAKNVTWNNSVSLGHESIHATTYKAKPLSPYIQWAENCFKILG